MHIRSIGLPKKMKQNKSYPKHYEESRVVNATPEAVFGFADNHTNLSAHMNKSSFMMAGSKLETRMDGGNAQVIGSHITMDGKVLGIKLFLDEVVIKREPPRIKEWETVGKVKLVVIGDYLLGFRLEGAENKTKITVYIDYDLPVGLFNRVLGILFGGVYAKWCVKQMLASIVQHFK